MSEPVRIRHEVETAFAAALELPESEQLAFIAREYGSNPSVYADVLSLLRAHRAASGFLERDKDWPTRMGPYRIVDLIGEGGMGSVFLAERDDGQFQQRVAIKMITAGLGMHQELLQRFLRERQILAALTHPGIGRLLDGGYTDDGAPYLVMEYVEGLPITDWCDRQNLGIPGRLRLFQKLCHAVQFAHQNLVIHRDLKPLNVLVTSDGEPKLLDFGIAKLVDAGGESTRTLARAFTFDYASPEQVRGGAITTAADIYSLGVLLYELVAGKRPYSVAERSLEEAVESICKRDPPAPRAVATRPLPDDVDAIVLKAMRKEPGERYASANELADDIERVLTSRPVVAKRGTVRYVAARFAHRHRAGVAVTALGLVAAFAATGFVVWESRIANHERDHAQKRFDDVRALARTVIFDLQHKLAEIPGTTEVRKDLVTVAVNYLDGLARDTYADRGLESELAAAYLQIGDIQGNFATHNVGDVSAALTSYRKSDNLARKLIVDRASDDGARNILVNALTAEAYALSAANDRDQAALKAAEALQVSKERARFNSGVNAQIQLGAALQCAAGFADREHALALLLDEVAVFEHLLTLPSHNATDMRNAALPHKYVAANLLVGGSFEAAFEHLRRAEELDRACVREAPNHPEHKMDLAIDLSQWGTYFARKGDTSKAIEYTMEAVAIRRELAAADPHDVRAQDRLAYILGNLGLLQLKDSPRQALASYTEAESIARRLPTESLRRMELAAALSGIGAAYRALGNRTRSCLAYAESVNLYRLELNLQPHYAELAAEARTAYGSCPGSEH